MSYVKMKHPSEPKLFAYVSGRVARGVEEHLSGCKRCSQAVEVYRSVVSVLLDEAAFEEQVENEAATLPTPLPIPVLMAIEEAREAEEIAQEIGGAQAAGNEQALTEALDRACAVPAGRFAIVYACQSAARLAAKSPKEAISLARRVRASLTAHPPPARDATITDSALIAETELLQSQGELNLGHATEARDLARAARPKLGSDRFGLARADYFEGSAAGFAGAYDEARELLSEAATGFARAQHDAWIGRAEAALGLVLFQQANDPEALVLFESALERLDEDADGHVVASIQMNRGGLLSHLGRLGEARVAFQEALELAVRSGASNVTLSARMNLAELAHLEGQHVEAASSFRKLADSVGRYGNNEKRNYCLLYAAECLAAAGRTKDVDSLVDEVRRLNAQTPDPALADLFACLDAGDVEVGVIQHVRRYVERRDGGVEEPYRAFGAA